jgi:hypothetical protein
VTGGGSTWSLLQDKARYDRGEVAEPWWAEFVAEAPGIEGQPPIPEGIPVSPASSGWQSAYQVSVLLFSGLVLAQLVVRHRIAGAEEE